MLQPLQKTVVIKKLNTEFTMWCNNCTLQCILPKLKAGTQTYASTSMFVAVLFTIVKCSRNNPTQISFKRQMNKMWYIHIYIQIYICTYVMWYMYMSIIYDVIYLYIYHLYLYPYLYLSVMEYYSWHSDMSYNMDKPWKYVKWNKLDTKAQIYDSTYMSTYNRQIHRGKM